MQPCEGERREEETQNLIFDDLCRKLQTLICFSGALSFKDAWSQSKRIYLSLLKQ